MLAPNLEKFLKTPNLYLTISNSLPLAPSFQQAVKGIYIIQKLCEKRYQSFLVIYNFTLFQIFSPAFWMVQRTLIQNAVLIYIQCLYKTHTHIETLKNTTWNRKKQDFWALIKNLTLQAVGFLGYQAKSVMKSHYQLKKPSYKN